MRLESLDALLIYELKHLYSAEKQLTKALPKMAKAASSVALKKLIETHLKETEQQVARLEEIFEELGQGTRGPRCQAMEGLIEEGSELIKEHGDPAVKDAALIAAAQRVEHYEIAAYGATRAFAQLLGRDRVAELLEATLHEESNADKLLNDLAESEVNVEAHAAAQAGA